MMHSKLWRVVAITSFLASLIVFLGLIGSGWYYSGVLKEEGLVPDWSWSDFDLEIVVVEQDQITLRATAETEEDGPWIQDGIWGLELAGSYHQVGSIVEVRDREVVREFFPNDTLPLAGQMARLNSSSYSGDPQDALGLAFQEVSFSSPLGEFPAWLVNGTDDTWVIFVHGKGNNRQEALRMLPTMAELGLPSLIISYRNDEGLQEDPSGFYQYGRTEFEDLEAAAGYAFEHGAKDLILVGYSMGGAIVTNFLYQSPLASRTRGVILDSPLLDFNATVDLGAREMGIPGVLTAVGKLITSIRFDLDWDALDYLSGADSLMVPILLFHGDEDKRVPVETSDAFAESRPDLVTYIRMSGVPHVRAWNVDPVAYSTIVRDFARALSR